MQGMTDMKIHIGGKEADASANELAEFFADNLDTQVSPAAAETLSDIDKKAIDPIAVVQLILAIPPAIMVTLDLAERIELRKKISKLIELAKRLRNEKGTVARLEASSVSRDLDAMSPDEVLDAAANENAKDQT
jgi:hypothetical protein